VAEDPGPGSDGHAGGRARSNIATAFRFLLARTRDLSGKVLGDDGDGGYGGWTASQEPASFDHPSEGEGLPRHGGASLGKCQLIS